MTHEEKQKLAVIKSLFESWNTVDARTGAHGIAKNHYDNLAREILKALRELERSKVVSTGDYIIDDNGYTKIEE